MEDFLKRWWPIMLVALTTITDQFIGVVTAWVAEHPNLAVAIGGVLTAGANLMKSPLKPKE